MTTGDDLSWLALRECLATCDRLIRQRQRELPKDAIRDDPRLHELRRQCIRIHDRLIDLNIRRKKTR